MKPPKPVTLTAPEVREAMETGAVTLRREVNLPAWEWLSVDEDRGRFSFTATAPATGGTRSTHWMHCPFGQPSDVMWVREPWWQDHREPDGVIIYDATPEWAKDPRQPELIRATCIDGTVPNREEARAAMLPKFWSLQPAETMPDHAARLTLRLTRVTVEQHAERWMWNVTLERVDERSEKL